MTEQDTWRSEDWVYNIMGIFVGSNASQYRAAADFDNEVTELILKKIKKKPS